MSQNNITVVKKCQKVFKSFFKNCLQSLISISILIFIFIPIFIIILLPIYTFRKIVSTWSDLFIPAHGKILTTLSSMFAVDEMTVDPTCTILLTLSLENEVSEQDVRKRVQGLLNTRKYPELQQSLTKWMGFYFWKDSRFCLDDHVKSISQPMGDDDIQRLKNQLLKKPYLKDKPLWDMTIVSNYVGNNPNAKSVCFNRFHHCLVDGFSLYKLNSQLSDSPQNWENDVPKQPRNGIIRNCLISLNLLVFGPFELISSLINTFDVNEWKFKPGSTAKDGILAETDKTTFVELKSIANTHGVSISALLIASYTGAMRRMMMNYGKGQIPRKVTIICPFPMSGHPDKLRIHVTMAPIKAFLGTEDPIQRLLLLQRQFDDLKTSTLPLAYYFSIKVLGGLFPCMIKLLSKGSGMGTGIVTNFPGPKAHVDIFGSKLTGLSVLIGVAHGSQTSGCAFVSYGGQVCITTGFDKALFSKQEMVDEFLAYVLNEFEILKEYKLNDVVTLNA